MLVLGALLGAGLMFLLDPDRGRRRRARLRDRIVHGVHEAEHLGEATASSARHIRNQALGARPTTDTKQPLADAFLWVKTPGQSDGTCNGGPRADPCDGRRE